MADKKQYQRLTAAKQYMLARLMDDRGREIAGDSAEDSAKWAAGVLEFEVTASNIRTVRKMLGVKEDSWVSEKEFRADLEAGLEVVEGKMVEAFKELERRIVALEKAIIPRPSSRRKTKIELKTAQQQAADA